MTSHTNDKSGGFLAHMQFKWKMLAMVSLPLLAVTWFAATDIYESWTEYGDAGSALEIADLSVSISALVHELQKERGTSAGYLGSKGAKYNDAMSTQRKDTDAKTAEFHAFLQDLPMANFDPQLASLLKTATRELDQINSFRSRISNLSIPTPEALAFYTGMNGKFLSLVTFSSKLAVSPALANTSTAYANFLLSKERAGVERAVMANAFSTDRLDNATSRKFQALVNDQATYMAVFTAAATAEANAFFTTTMTDRSVDEVSRMRAVASQTDANFGIDSEYWFDMATARINLLKTVDNWLAEDLAKSTGEFADEARSNFIEAAVLAAVALGASLLLAMTFSKMILQQLGNEPATLLTIVDAIANGNLQMDLSSAKPTTGIFSAMQKMQRKLRKRVDTDQRALEESTRLKSALDSVQANVMMADADNNIIYINDTVLAMFKSVESQLRNALPNFNADDLIGKNIDIFHKNPAHQRSMLASLSSKVEADIEVAELHFKVIATPVVDADGKRLGTVAEWDEHTQELRAEEEINRVVSAVLQGDLTERIDMDGKVDFFKVLGNGINGIVEKLAGAMGEIGRTSSQVRSGSDEIAQGNANLSQRTEEQAASLEETASSMAEMTTTVKNNADAAVKANTLAASARDKAEHGGEVVSNAVRAMEEISASSKKIADIISTIDEIAFQTNLLALNASVEAARAGEQGRGFAVVASEVRNLAGRSANAAKEIKDLIEDSVSKVENGTRLVNESGKTLGEIVSGVREVTNIVDEIAKASHEQSIGIDEVNKAITQMDEMTQQNAALVEEIAASSESLRRQSGELGDLVSAYKVDSSHAVDSGGTAERRSGDRPWVDRAPAAPEAKAAGGENR